MTDEIERLLDEQEDGEREIWELPETVGAEKARRGRRTPREGPAGREAGDGPESGGPESAGPETEERADDGADTLDAWKKALDGTEEQTREEKRPEGPDPQGGTDGRGWAAGKTVRRPTGSAWGTTENGQRLPRARRALGTGDGERGTEGTETLYRRLRQAGEAAQYRGRAEAAAELTPPPLGAGRLSLHELDRAFQRDARRYDNGFELF